MKHLFNLLLIMTLLPSQNALAQRYPIRTYTVRDGLPQMQVTATLLDSQGYLWVGTKTGLAKFDGEHFETFDRHDFGLASSNILSLAEDQQHNIWVSTTMGIVRFDGATFRPFLFEGPMQGIATLLEIDGQNRIWLLQSDDSQQLYLFANGRFRLAREVVRGLGNVQVGAIRAIQWDQTRQKLWLIGSQASQPQLLLFAITDNQCQFYARLPEGSVFRKASGQTILQTTDMQGHITYATLDPSGKPLPFLSIGPAGNNVLRPVGFDLFLMKPGTGKFYRYAHRTQQLELIHDSPGNLSQNMSAIRKGDRVYLGTEKGLLELIDNGLRYFEEQQAPYVWSVIGRPNGDVWWLNYGTPIQRFTPDGRVEPLQEPGLNKLMAQKRAAQQNLWHRYYYHPTYDRQGNLYLPHESGLVQYDGKAWRFLKDSVAVLYVYADDHSDRVFAAINGGFLVFQNSQLIRKITRAEGFHECPYGLCAVADTEPNVYWLGSGRGITRYDALSGKMEHFTEANGKLPSLGVIDLCRDPKGTVWMASRDGLLRYDRKSQKVVRATTDVLTKKLGFVRLLTDSTLIAGDVQGIYLIDLNAFYQTGRLLMRLLNHRTGYLGIEPGQAGFFKDRQGRGWITSNTVLSYIDTRQFAYQPQPLLPIIRRLNNQRLPFHYADSVFALSGEQTTARLSFEVLGDNQPTQSQYAWQLDNGPWSDWQTEPYTVLRDYDGGTHTFRFKARTGSLNEAQEQVATLRFRANIPFYNNPSFRSKLPQLLFGLLLLGVLLLLYSVDNRRKAYHATQLLNEREKEALFLNAQTLQAQLNTHFMFNVLMPLQNLILQNRSEEAAHLLVAFSKLVRGFLNASATGNGTHRAVNLIEREIPLSEEIDLLTQYVRFEQLLYRDKITVHFDASSLDGKINPDLVTLPPMLIQPFVENAIKHGLVHKQGAGNLWIRFLEVDETLICTIEDDGIGRAQMQQIHQTSRRAYKSLGTSLVQQRVDMLNQLGYKIRIRTDDRQAGGTVVTLTFSRT